MDTSKVSDTRKTQFKGFDSIYDKVNTNRWELKNLGYDYGSSLMEDNTSRYLQRNTMVSDMFVYLNKILTHLIDSVKYLRNYNNYAVPKDYKHIN